MITDTQRDDPVLLGEAEAIVEAEWIRLDDDEDTWEREVGELLAALPTPAPGRYHHHRGRAARRSAAQSR